jgi:hypothetical protein
MNDEIFSLKVMKQINSNFCFEVDDECSMLFKIIMMLFLKKFVTFISQDQNGNNTNPGTIFIQSRSPIYEENTCSNRRYQFDRFRRKPLYIAKLVSFGDKILIRELYLRYNGSHINKVNMNFVVVTFAVVLLAIVESHAIR